MRAFAIDQFGETGSIHELPEPAPEEGQVRVRVEAASLNPADNVMASGVYKDMMEHRFPQIPGYDFGGVVDAVGSGVTGLEVGDAVFGQQGKPFVGEGTLAEYVTATTGTITHRPATIDAAFGAALSLAGVSALQMIDEANLKAGESVLVIGAAGGIGSFLLQLIAAAGAKPIAVSRAVNHEYVRSLGAVETIDYTAQDVFATVRSAHPDGIAAIFDMVGDRATNTHLAELLPKGGYLFSMVGAADPEALAALGFTGVNVMTQPTTERLNRLAEYVEAGTLKRPEFKTFRLEDAAQAFTELSGRHVRGKLIIVP